MGAQGVQPAVTEDLTRLRVALDGAVRPGTPDNLLVATWNLRGLSDLTQKWHAARSDSPKRDWHAIACIA